MFKKVKKIMLAAMVGLITLSPVTLGTNNEALAASRDFDGNAIIRGGALSVSELKKDIDGNPSIKNLFGTMGIKTSQFGDLKNGTVYKNGKVRVGLKTVATDVNSWGRHNFAGSTKDTRFNYPVYYRHPRVSFNSNSLPAFVKLNPDGSFAYAIVKSCGNPILKGINANITSPRFKVTINKFADDNMNKVKDGREKALDDVTFTISGKGIKTQWKKTNNAGQVVFTGIPKGNYKVQESYNPKYWKPTTSSDGIQNVTVNGNETMWFGNKWQEKHKVTINKFADDNMNKVKDANEKMLDDITFTISGKGIKTQWKKTNNAGQLVFTGIPNGTYKVQESFNPTWWKPTTSSNGIQTVTVNGDEVMWFGNKWQRHNVIVNKFSDANMNKIKDAGEIMLDNVTFTISGTGIKTQWLATDKNGQVKFTNIPNGTYKIQESYNPKFWKPTTSTNGIQYVTVKDGNAVAWFGNKFQVKQVVKVLKFEDLNSNNKRDAGEKVLPNFTFKIDNSATTAVTGADGIATFDNVSVGNHSISEINIPAGWKATHANPFNVSVTSGQTVTIEFGNVKTTIVQQTHKLLVNKFNDLNKDGTKQANEPVLSGRVFRLTGPNVDITGTTNASGQILFDQLGNGNYVVTETLPSGWIATTTNPLNVVINNADATVSFGNVQVTVAQTFNVIVSKFNDKNSNAQRESDEEFLSGWEFTISGNGANSKLSTDASGKLTFTGLGNGTYTLTETAQNGWTATTQNPLSVVVNGADASVLFGNHREEEVTPPTPVTPTPPEEAVVLGKGVVALPAAGVKETLLAFSVLAFGYALYNYRKSRRKLLNSMRS